MAGNIGSQYGTPTPEAQSLADLLAWSRGRRTPHWQRDALRRLCTKDKLDDTDLDELTLLCKNSSEGDPLSEIHIPDPKVSASKINLRSIRSVEGVNALAPNQHLEFGKSGVTIVYGENGAGKSGYARILKNACRAQIPKGDQLLTNVYNKAKFLPKATISFSVDDENREIEWRYEETENPYLSAVNVFDSKTANVHVNEKNDISYIPFPLKLLEGLASACKEVRSRIQEEIDNLAGQTPGFLSNPICRPHTRVGKMVNGLNERTPKEHVYDLATLAEGERGRMDQLRADIATPKSQVEMAKGHINRIDELERIFRRLGKELSDSNVAHLGELYFSAEKAEQEASIAANDLFANEPLPHVGSKIWRALWDAARAYSEKEAYTEDPFPVIKGNTHCVLCQQKLDEVAAKRFMRFDSFVKDEAMRKADKAKEDYARAMASARDADISLQDITRALKSMEALDDPQLLEPARRAALTMKWRLRGILRNHQTGRMEKALPKAEEWPSEKIAKHREALSDRIDILLADERSSERQSLIAELAELEDRDWLATVVGDVISEIDRRKQRERLSEVLKKAATNRVTRKSREISDKLVTEAMRLRFEKEIGALGLADLPVSIQGSARYGAFNSQVDLGIGGGVRNSDILSEGEHRCVAIAVFLTDLAMSSGQSSIVFDDPVSSLDHIYRRQLAKRLAEEGQHRQVIVFTHDLTFLFLLEGESQDRQVHVTSCSVARGGEGIGVIQMDRPTHAKPIDRVLEGMKVHLNNVQPKYQRDGSGGWDVEAGGLVRQLRTTWERAVEAVVEPVLKRLSDKVNTGGLIKLTVLTRDDCVEMRSAYSRLSRLLHSSADGLAPNWPNPVEIREEIEKL